LRRAGPCGKYAVFWSGVGSSSAYRGYEEDLRVTGLPSLLLIGSVTAMELPSLHHVFANRYGKQCCSTQCQYSSQCMLVILNGNCYLRLCTIRFIEFGFMDGALQNIRNCDLACDRLGCRQARIWRRSKCQKKQCQSEQNCISIQVHKYSCPMLDLVVDAVAHYFQSQICLQIFKRYRYLADIPPRQPDAQYSRRPRL
jgi:hypothetical protein